MSAKECCKCSRVGHLANKCKWPNWRAPRPEASRAQKRAGVIPAQIKGDK